MRGNRIRGGRRSFPLGLTNPGITPNRRQAYNHDRRRELQARAKDWVYGRVSWTKTPPDIDHLDELEAANTRHLVAMLRHDYTDYHLQKSLIYNAIRDEFCPGCYRQNRCKETGLPEYQRIPRCEFYHIVKGALFKEATLIVLAHLGLEWGDGWVWREGAIGAIAASWGYNPIPEISELKEVKA